MFCHEIICEDQLESDRAVERQSTVAAKIGQFFFFYSEVERRQLAGKVSVKDVRRQRGGPKKMSDGSLGKVMRR